MKFILINTSLLITICMFITCTTGTTDSNKNGIDDSTAILSTSDLELDKISLPPRFHIELFGRVPNARSLAMSPQGTIYVGNRSGDKVYAVVDNNNDNKADKRYLIASGLKMPNGVAFRDGSLYVAEVSKLWRYDDIENNLDNPPEGILIYSDYPTDKHHGWKYIAFGPDDRLYVPVGAPCNICKSKKEIYASITSMLPDGSDRKVVAHGVRNTVGFTWHPTTRQLWFTDNGRDWLGNDSPPCELNKVETEGDHFGYPYCHGGFIRDPEFGSTDFPCSSFVAPVQNLSPHVAPLGLKFYTGSRFPKAYHHTIFIAEHGSWNRDQEVGHTGYKITRVIEKEGKGIKYEDFATGFLNKETNIAWGRPVDILVTDSGDLLVSDDLAGAIYRIWYE